MEVPEPSLWRDGISSRSTGSSELIEKAMELLLGTDKPCIIAGHGAVLSEAAPELIKLAELLNIPVATTANGKGVIPADHPLSLGPVGRNGSYMANEILPVLRRSSGSRGQVRRSAEQLLDPRLHLQYPADKAHSRRDRSR